VERSRVMGMRLEEEMKSLLTHPIVGDIRAFGFMLGVELVSNKATKRPASVDTIKRIIAQCKSKGLIIGKNGDTVAGYNNVLTISPPLSSTDEDLSFLIATFKEVMAANPEC
jgi:taurine-pyruvate aminotransferase